MKRMTVVLLTAAMLLTLFCGCGSRGEKQTEYTGIISAMDNEIELLLEEAEIDHADTIGGVEYHVGKLHDRPVVITRAGIGKIRASAGVTALLSNYHISRVIFLPESRAALQMKHRCLTR